MPNIQIRTATLADLDAISHLADESSHLHHQQAPEVFAEPDRLRDLSLWQERLSIPSHIVFVATLLNSSTENIIGFLSAQLTQTPPVPVLVQKTFCRIGTIVVGSAYGGLGAGRMLMQAAENWAKTQAVDEIRLEVMAFNEKAMKLYSNEGFETSFHTFSKRI